MREESNLKFLLNYKRLIRKFLGRDLTFKMRNIVSTIAFKCKAIPPATSINRKEGISAMVCTYNEEDWIEPSLLSVKSLVDEYIVVDSSRDRTPEIIQEVAKEHRLNLKMEKIPPGNLLRARELALRLSTRKWILVWDGDFIAKDEAPKRLKKLLKSLDPRRYYLIYWPHLRIDKDLFHKTNSFKFHTEHWLFTFSPTLKYSKLHHFEYLVAPLTYYKAILLEEPLSLHLRNVSLYKSLKALKEKQERSILDIYPTVLKEYIKKKMN